MGTWPNRGASGGPCGGWKRENPKPQAVHLTIEPTRFDSSQQASSKPGAVQASRLASRTVAHLTPAARSGQNSQLACSTDYDCDGK